ncbi:MAG: hypothetical protein ACXU7D_06225 [Burkholderiaceae bacterium]
MKKIILVVALLGTQFSFAQEKIYVQSPAAFLEGDSIRNAVRDECNLDQYLGSQTLQAVARSKVNAIAFSAADPVPSDDAAVVNISILSVTGNGGSGFTGAKSMTVRSDYQVGGKVIATKTLTVSTRGGAFSGAFKGICSILAKDADSIAKKIAGWLRGVRGHSIADLDMESSDSPMTIYLISPIEYVDSNNIRQAIKTECAIQSVTEAYILERSNIEKYPFKQQLNYDDKGTAMRVTIVDGDSSSGGIYSGEKSLKMRVDLLKDGNINSTKDFEIATKGSLNYMTTSCQVIEKLIKSFSVSSVRWVLNELLIKPNSKFGKKAERIGEAELTEKPAEDGLDKKE